MEFTAPIRWRSLKAASAFTFFTRSWQSSNAPRTAMLWMFASCSEYICAAWNGVMRFHGERELGIGEAPPALQIGARQALGHVQPAIGREAFQKDVGKALRPAAAAGADVAHVLPLRLALRAELVEPADMLGRGLLMRGR